MTIKNQNIKQIFKDRLLVSFLGLIVFLLIAIPLSFWGLSYLRYSIKERTDGYIQQYKSLSHIEHQLTGYFHNLQYNISSNSFDTDFATARKIKSIETEIEASIEILLLEDNSDLNTLLIPIDNFIKNNSQNTSNFSSFEKEEALLKIRSAIETLEKENLENITKHDKEGYAKFFIFLNIGLIVILIMMIILFISIYGRKKAQSQIDKQKSELIKKNEELDKLNNQLKTKIKETLEVNEQLQISKLKAEESDKLKTAFLANMSHEIRTPMNAIIGFSDYLCTMNLGENVNKYLNIIVERGNDLLNIINDILDISRIESNQMEIRFKDFDINELLIEIKQEMEILSDIPIIIDAEDVKVRIVTDPLRLKQIVSNLVSNSVKYSDRGVIKISMKIKNNSLNISVEDEGVGMAEDQLEIIFDRFRQLEEHRTKRVNGIGLGLSISKGLVDLLNGKISVKSKVGKGSVFSISIPIQTVGVNYSVEEDGEIIKPSKEDIDILVVEDDDTTVLLYKAILDSYNYNLTFFRLGIDAVDYFRKNKVDIVLLDLNLPDKDGYELIKDFKLLKPNIPVIAQTAYAMEHDKENILLAGFDGYIPKPIDKAQLIKTIDKSVK